MKQKAFNFQNNNNNDGGGNWRHTNSRKIKALRKFAFVLQWNNDSQLENRISMHSFWNMLNELINYIKEGNTEIIPHSSKRIIEGRNFSPSAAYLIQNCFS